MTAFLSFNTFQRIPIPTISIQTQPNLNAVQVLIWTQPLPLPAAAPDEH